MCKYLRNVIPEFDIVVPLPRGGFLPASIIASKFGKPLATPDMFLKSKYWWTTSIYVDKPRGNNTEFNMDIPKKEDWKILLVDDVSYNGQGLLWRTKKLIQETLPKTTVFKVAPYCFERTKAGLDYYCKVINIEHWFEKDLLIRKRGTAPIFVDMDGVLCDDSPCFSTYDEKVYLESIKLAKPYLIPHWTIDAIITGRLEKYRPETEQWLKENKVKYNKLIMQEGNQITGTNHAMYKSKVIKSLSLPPIGSIMIESSLEQSKVIYKETGIQVICTETNQLFGATDIGYKYHPAIKVSNLVHPVELQNDMLKPIATNKSGYNWLFPHGV